MEILWLQDLPLSSIGGAQYTDELIFIEGIRKGYNISVRLPRDLSEKEIEAVDLLVLSNIYTFSDFLLQKIMESKIPYVNFFHDHNFCFHRAYYPMAEKCRTHCPRRIIWERLSLKSNGNIYLSPLHFRAYKHWSPAIENIPSLIIPPPIRPELLRKKKEIFRLPNTVCYIGPLVRYKGIENILEYAKSHTDLQFNFFGPISPYYKELILKAGHSVHGIVPNRKLWMVFYRHEYLIHLPSFIMPGERVVLEALFCDCKLILNELVGMTSYPWFKEGNKETILKHLLDSPNKFWEFIGGIF